MWHSYHEEGCIIVENVLDPAQLKSARNIIDDILANARGKPTHDDIYDFEPTHTPDNPRVRRIKKPHVIKSYFGIW